ncbi:MAG TPA: S1C family serine protease [Terracidiphilus sp.]|jgi:S1-C subfamily serine protease
MPGTLAEFSQQLANLVEMAGQSVVSVLEGGRTGVSGTVWREGIGVVVDHTIQGLEEVTVILPSGAETKAAVTARDLGTDIALLKLPTETPAAALADDSTARPGEIVLSVGRRGTEGLAAAYGLISAISGPWRTSSGGRFDRWFRLDLNPFPGFSGGPIVNADCEVLGIATSGPGRSAAVVPAATVNRVVDQLLKHGHTLRGYIGIGVQPVVFPDDAWQTLGIGGGRGLLITAVAPVSAATDAGLILGDVIVAIDGKSLQTGATLQSILDGENVGKSVPLDIVRGGHQLRVDVVVRERPAS